MFFGHLHLARSDIACGALGGFGDNGWLAVGFSTPDAVASVTPGGKFAGRVQASGLRSFGKLVKASPSPASGPPNKSFKPTPCRDFVETSGHAGNTGSHPSRSARLNSGVRRQKAFGSCVVSAATYRLRSALLFGSFVGTSFLRSSSSGALTHRMRCVGRLR